MNKQNSIVNIQNPIPILQQPKSSVIKNILIPNEQQEVEYEIIDTKEKEKLDEENEKMKKTGIKYTSFATLHTRISESILGVIVDFFEKPKDEYWIEHIPNIFIKDQRYAYIGMFLVIIAIIIHITKLNLNIH